ncbi:IclR family transcriptional regulator [Occultella gossypii]|uniref:IclR family transcriptional regulator n=1 Tax=Occultella gossypii TaxID=2800820 RepID=A0ABS7S7P1_9MICO|nr:IclR family transcriptional regulator [Occultella gossypii]MBZ2196366.1 IclR family transcriptional regulator [Occultella gossypii]
MTEQSPMGSVDKALLVLTDLSAAGPRGRSLADLAEAVSVSKSTLHRTLAALRFRHFVAQDPVTGWYRLGAAAIDLGATFIEGDNLPALLHPMLESIRDSFDELCQLGVLDGPDVVYVDKAEPAHAIRVWSAVGRRIAALTTALGRALLAAGEVDRRVLGRLAPPARFTPEEVQRSWEAVVNARLDGYAVERGESEPGIGCVAVAILRARRPVAAVSVTMPLDRLEHQIPELGRRLRRVVEAELPGSLTLPPTL